MRNEYTGRFKAEPKMPPLPSAGGWMVRWTPETEQQFYTYARQYAASLQAENAGLRKTVEYWHQESETIKDQRDALQARVTELQAAITHYDAALKCAFPEGAYGEAFDHWNAARAALKKDPST